MTGSRNSLPRSPFPTPFWLKSNMLSRLPELASALPEMDGRPQLSSTNLVIDAWLVSVLSTKLVFAHSGPPRCAGPSAVYTGTRRHSAPSVITAALALGMAGQRSSSERRTKRYPEASR